MVAKKEKAKNWSVVFLGAGIENWMQEARAMGATGQSVTSYVPDDQTIAYASLGVTTSKFLRTNSAKAQSLGADTETEIKKRKRTTPKS